MEAKANAAPVLLGNEPASRHKDQFIEAGTEPRYHVLSEADMWLLSQTRTTASPSPKNRQSHGDRGKVSPSGQGATYTVTSAGERLGGETEAE